MGVYAYDQPTSENVSIVKNQSNHITHSMQPLPIVMLPLEDFSGFLWKHSADLCL